MTSLPPSSSPTPLPHPDTTATDTVATTVGNTSGGGGGSGIINDCTSLLQKRHDCYVKHYTKRCQSFLLCHQEAIEYYKSPSDTYHPEDNPKGPKEKGICSAYDEQYCFGNPQLMKIDLEGNKRTKKAIQREKQRKDTFDHHEKSLTRVLASHHKQGT
eukprot:CAMPEP_0170977940 /NCGR_PEP_ID=MMETSP0736-20130129/898_1 /TAXON_ID=186038 /ORGANISM="Fragilariopsis kerguelensis, Strain L26-C5" /LENGTH=157 /DNA_ID=CAMNT_0011400205 /DNA_START=235 /DNA_END=704 /DNA_ORIENTATION=-